MEPTEEMPGQWQVVFMTSDRHRTSNENGGRPGATFLWKAFAKFYGDSVDKKFDFESSENTHVAFCDSKEHAERVAAEIVYVLEAAGLKPMSGTKKDHPVPRAPQFYYTICEVVEEDEGQWGVTFMTSDLPDGVNASGDTPGAGFLRALFARAYGAEAVEDKFRFEEMENLHVAVATSEAEAWNLAAEISYIMESSGMKPLDEDDNLRRTITPRAPQP